MLSSSPRDVQLFLNEASIDDGDDKDDDSSRKAVPFLQDFLRALPYAIRQRKTDSSSPNRKDPITELFK